jgi:uncharacterized protein (TIGR03435 family)
MLLRIFAIAFISFAAQGQQFEVASLKPSAGEHARGSTGFSTSLDSQQLSYTGVTPMRLLTEAYGVKRYQINGSAWLDSERFDLSAKLPEGTSKDQIPAMLQHLLAERFHMKLHSETKPERIYALLAGKNGPRLPSTKDPDHGQEMSFDVSGHMNFLSTTLAGFAETMSRLLDRPVIDRTGIQGAFDITLNVSMQDLTGLKQLLAANGVQVDAAEGTSIFSAVQELGLKLESRNAPIEHLVVDSAEKIPTGN